MDYAWIMHKKAALEAAFLCVSVMNSVLFDR